ncbi:MAG: hypothetical protein Q9M89_03045 [Persephonella sp.]|nr:hypothetical protein [Persephonella sp.]
MRIPIGYAISYPDRWETGANSVGLFDVSPLEFYKPDENRFPLLKIARECGERGSFYPIVLTVADELAVDMFLKGEISFTQISHTVDTILQKASFKKPESYEDVINIIEETEKLFKNLFKKTGGKVA